MLHVSRYPYDRAERSWVVPALAIGALAFVLVLYLLGLRA